MAQQRRSGGTEEKGFFAGLRKASDERLSAITTDENELPAVREAARHEIEKRQRAASHRSLWNSDWEV